MSFSSSIDSCLTRILFCLSSNETSYLTLFERNGEINVQNVVFSVWNIVLLSNKSVLAQCSVLLFLNTIHHLSWLQAHTCFRSWLILRTSSFKGIQFYCTHFINYISTLQYMKLQLKRNNITRVSIPMALVRSREPWLFY